jgi:chitodextrinase
MNRLLIRVLALSSILEICILCTHPIVRPAAAAPPTGYYTLQWSDEFDEPSGQLDTNKWGYLLLGETFGKFDEGCNVRDAVSLDGQGNLVITTWTEHNVRCKPSDPVGTYNKTGMIATGDDRMTNGQPWFPPHLSPPNDKRVATYGYIEARIKFTGAQNVWSSYWFQSPTFIGFHNPPYSPPYDPRAAGTEIDVVEHHFNSPDAPSALHWDAYCQNPPDPTKPAKSAGSSNHSGCGSLNTGFHTYGLEWTPDVLRFYYDAVLVWTVNNSGQLDPPSQITCPWSDPGPPPATFLGPVSRAGEYITLDNEVRGTGVDYGPKGNKKNAKMTVDYVRWYEDIDPPATVQDLLVSGQHGRTTMAVSWTAPGDDGTGQTATKYDLRYSTSQITDANFSSATFVTSTPPPHAAGFPECQLITGLTECTTYYFAIKTMDEAGNWSAISNLPSATTECDINFTASCPTLAPDNVAPGNVSNLSLSAGNASMRLSWTAPGDDGNSPGRASEYDLRWSPLLINAANFDMAARASIAAPQVQGASECRVVSGLCAGTTYYFAIKAKDEWGNWSGISNVPSAPTLSSGNPATCGQGLSLQPGPSNYAGASPTVAGSLSFSKPYPNPARGATRFRIMVPGSIQGAKLRVQVFDVAGRLVRSLVDRTASQGETQVEWNLLDGSGRRVASALYMVRVDVGNTRKTFPLLVLR